MSDAPIIMAKGLTKTYRTGKLEVQALRGIDFAVQAGEMVAVMGPSGCGKTTLLNCLSGLDEPTEGEVWIEGIPLWKMSDDEKTEHRARHMGFIFQFYNLLPVLTAVENVELPLLVGEVHPKEARERALEALENVGLRGHAEHTPSELSGGERQRVTIARALVNRPAIVWADEPTGDLDQETSAEIVSLMCDLNETHGATFVVVTHATEVASKMDRVVRMQSGRIVHEGMSYGGP
ncbi:MAG: ABC transporter ATP-binding protein [Candidatus Thermoplasmatota archaeon]